MQLLAPMMANNAESNRSDFYLSSPEWWAEQKVDGNRLMVHIDNGEITALQGRNSSKIILPPALKRQFAAFSSGQWVFDGELVSGEYKLFDLPIAGTHVGLATPYELRRKALDLFFEKWAPSEGIKLVTCHRTEPEKRALLQTLMDNGGEGLMFKSIKGIYRPGKRVDTMRKHKFIKTVDAIVTRLRVEMSSHTGDLKENCAFGVYRETPVWAGGVPLPATVQTNVEADIASKKIFEIGKSSTTGKRGEGIKVGDVIEVKFLYCVDPSSPRVVQPRLVKIRTDKRPDQCLIAQLDGTFTDKSVNA